MQIHRDAFNGDYDAVLHALNAGATVDVTDTLETTPLMAAVASPHFTLQTIQLLLQRGANPNAEGGRPYRSVLGHALLLNDPKRVELLLAAGADVNAVDESGCDALIWAVQGPGTHLLEVVELLLQRGAIAKRESDEGESALDIASGRGRFDVVKKLLAAGADEKCLEWTPLMRAIAFGTLEEVRSRLLPRNQLLQKDSWHRTPWLLALAVGDLQVVQLLLDAGANQNDKGYAGKTPLMYPLENNHTDVLQWLLHKNFNLNETNDVGRTALMEASSYDAIECVRLLLDAGADLARVDQKGKKAVDYAQSPQVVHALVSAGQDLSELSPDIRALMLGLDYEGEIAASREEFENGRKPRLGTANPEKMDVPFWHAMVRSGATAEAAHQKFDSTTNLSPGVEPVWSYHREGKSITALPDGRFIEIGGSHGDWYDEHFHVYNDVIVHQLDGSFEIYGYPAEVFPPTDFHSATLVNGYIYIIGCMGHMEKRVIGQTNVFRLNIETLAIELVETTGRGPGCISMHQGTLVGSEIQLCGGECTEMFILDLDSLQWRRKTV